MLCEPERIETRLVHELSLAEHLGIQRAEIDARARRIADTQQVAELDCVRHCDYLRQSCTPFGPLPCPFILRLHRSAVTLRMNGRGPGLTIGCRCVFPFALSVALAKSKGK